MSCEFAYQRESRWMRLTLFDKVIYGENDSV